MITTILSLLVGLFKATPVICDLVSQFVALHQEHEKQLAIQKAKANEIEALQRRDAKRVEIDAALALALAVYRVPDDGGKQGVANVPTEQRSATAQASAVSGGSQGGS